MDTGILTLAISCDCAMLRKFLSTLWHRRLIRQALHRQ